MIPLAGQMLNAGHLMQPTANATGQSTMISLPGKSAAGLHADISRLVLPAHQTGHISRHRRASRFVPGCLSRSRDSCVTAIVGFSNSSHAAKTRQLDSANPARLCRNGKYRHGKYKGRDSRHALCGLLLRSGRDNPQTSGLRWSPPVRIRHTRTKWRAQQRMSWATTGSSCLGLENLPRPARGSESSWRPSRVKVKRFLHPSQNCTGPQLTDGTRCTAARLRLSRTCYRVKVTGPDAR